MTNFWPGGTLVKMDIDASKQPARILWNGKNHAVDHVTRVRLVDDRWWTSARIWRVYYRITTDSGLLILVFRDVITSKWYVERLYD